MKVHIVVHHFPPRHVGGAELRAYNLASWLARNGHHVQVTCIESVEEPSCGQGISWADEIYDGLAVRRIHYNIHAWPEPIRWTYDFPALEAHYRQAFDDERPDLVHLVSGYLQGVAPLRVARALGIPAVVTLTDFWFLCPTIELLRADHELCWRPEPAQCVRCWLNRWRPIHWAETHIPAITRAGVALLNRMDWPLPALRRAHDAFAERPRVLLDELNRAHAIHCITKFLASVYQANGVRPELLRVVSYRDNDRTTAPRFAMTAPPQAVRFGYFGAVAHHKGIETLIRAFRRVPDRRGSQLHVFGVIRPPSYEARLRRLIGDDADIHLHGRYERDQLPELMSQVDVVVVPSIWHENAPRVIIEAFTHGCPVIGSDVGGIAELVEDGVNGLVFKRNDADALAQAMQQLISTPELIPQFRQRIPSLRLGDPEVEAVYAIYQEVLRHHGTRA
ncbi:MAG: glycosyltransferase family 4 protein [Anaerolineae bacterium]